MDFFICLAVIVLDIFIAREFMLIAEEKGYDNTKYFWWSLFLCIVGWMMVVALPMRKNNNDESNNLNKAEGKGENRVVIYEDEVPEI